jgi:hypothetical protein
MKSKNEREESERRRKKKEKKKKRRTMKEVKKKGRPPHVCHLFFLFLSLSRFFSISFFLFHTFSLSLSVLWLGHPVSA